MSERRQDLTGQKFNRLTAIKPSFNYFWVFKCDCGKLKRILSGAVKSGNSRSCGCLRREKVTKHGMDGSPTYISWKSMKARCLSPNSPDYKNYGGKGVKVCHKWASFQEFFKDMGERPKGTSLDRIDNKRDYKLSNCRWATPIQQGRNRSTNRTIKIRGEKKTLSEWAELSGINPTTISYRISKGYPNHLILKGVS